MKGALLAIGFALASTATLAQPPLKGATHTFVDPVFATTVFCDSYFELLAIATAAEPADVYSEFMARRNSDNEPVCAAMISTGIVMDVRPLGIMIRDNQRYDAWAIETRVGDATGFALYLEARHGIIA
jgi:hypothetical protein